MTNEKPKAEKKQASESPFPDFTQLLNSYRIPGVDFNAFVDREKKNIEALTRANEIAFEGWQALLRRQSEILQETMAQAIANARTQDSAAHRVEIAKEGFHKALANMRELAEMATRSQTEAFDVIRKRVSANVQEIQAPGKKE